MRPRLPTLLVVAALVAAACSDDTADESQPPAGDETTTSTTSDDPTDAPPEETIEATTTVTSVEGNPMAARVTIDANVDVTAQITATSDDHVVETPTTAATAAAHDLPLVGLRPARDYDLAVTLTGASGTTTVVTDSFTTGPLPEGLPELEIVRDPARSSPGVTMLELNPVIAAVGVAGNAVVGVDEDGEYVWHHNAGTFSGAIQRSPSGEITMQHDPFAFSVHDATGRRLAEYYPDPTGADVATVSADGVELIPFHADWVELGPIHHDLVPLDDGSFLGISTTDHAVPAARRQELCPGDSFEWDVFSDVIAHIDGDGTVLRTWDLWDIISFDDLPGEFLCGTRGIGVTETRRDWTHANALWWDGDRQAILVSSRHTDQIIALAMSEETGPLTDVRWILGARGTIPYEGESFHHTHGVKVVSGGDVLLYDNGNFRPGSASAGGTEPDYSRAVRIRVDDQDEDRSTWSATQVWDHRMTDPLTDRPLYSPFISDADELANGNILVTHGGAAWDPANFLTSHVHVVEIVPDADDPEGGEVVWELMLGTEDAPVSMYRADRWPSLYFGPLWADG